MPRGILLPEASVIIGRRIAARRKELNISQKDLAKRTNICRPTLSSYELGQAPITVEKLFLIAEVLETSIVFFIRRLNRTP